jgi:hypothetical protein
MSKASKRNDSFVMPALVAGIHVFQDLPQGKTWMAGTSPAMTVQRLLRAYSPP